VNVRVYARIHLLQDLKVVVGKNWQKKVIDPMQDVLVSPISQYKFYFCLCIAEIGVLLKL
jgi:hypothetical protein